VSAKKPRKPGKLEGKDETPTRAKREAFKPRVMPLPDPRFSRSMEYGIAILECFTAERQTLGIADMADMLGRSRSTAHRYAITLVELGCLEQDNKRKYRLSHNAARPGMAVIDTVRLENPAWAILEDLREKTGCTVSMGVLDGARALYIYRLFAHGAGQFEADGDLGVGAHVPMHCTAIGKALLASLPKGEFSKLLSEMRLERSAPNTITTKTLLTEEIERVRKKRIAVSDGEHVKGARSIAVPVTGRSGAPTFAIEVTAPTGAYTMQDLLARVGPPLKQAAKQISV
jgi:IclR family transcriptional regulator, pca regulon regulatory protein